MLQLPLWLKISLGFVIYALALAVVALWWNEPNLTTLILGLLVLGMFALSPRRTTLAAFLIGAIGGPLSEVVAVHFGAWSYADAQFFGIPVWLPLIWGLAAVTFTKPVLLLAHK